MFSVVISGAFEVFDCDTIHYGPGTLAIYTADQDPLTDPPETCAPFTFLVSRRVKTAPLCEVPPG